MNKIKNIAILQGVVVIYTISSLMSKKASASGGDVKKFIFWFALEFVVLGIYAILWQQAIKRFELSVAYANRSMAVVWSMVWAALIFHDDITLKNIIGVCLIVAGTIIVNTEGEETKNG